MESSLISDPQFAKRQVTKANPCLLVRDQLSAGPLYLLEPGGCCEYGATGYCLRDCLGRLFRRSCFPCVKVESVLKIPLRNSHSWLTPKGLYEKQGIKKVDSEINDDISLSDEKPNPFSNISSCEGLLCLSEDDCVAVGNPITGEFIYLPQPPNFKTDMKTVTCFGFSPKSNLYKVLRVCFSYPYTEKSSVAAEIHTLGTSTWRSVDVSPLNFLLVYGDSVVYFRGALHWIFRAMGNCPCSLWCFDLDEERVRYFIPLPQSLQKGIMHIGMSVLGGELCVYGGTDHEEQHIWALDEYGVAETWTKLASLTIPSLSGYTKVLSRLSDGGFVVFRNNTNALFYCDRLGRSGCKAVKSYIVQKLEAIAHTPSFLPLEEMVNTSDVEVFNVYSKDMMKMEDSGCVGVKLFKEDYDYASSGEAAMLEEEDKFEQID